MRRTLTLLNLTAAMVLATLSGAAQEPDSPSQATEAGPRVTQAYSVNSEDSQSAGLADRLAVKVEPFEDFLKQTPNGRCSDFVLFFDGIPMRGLDALTCSLDAQEVHFVLQRTPESEAAWHRLLGHPRSLSRRISVSLSSGGDYPIPSQVAEFRLRIFHLFDLLLFAPGLLIFLTLLIRLAKTTAILRDPTSEGLPVAERPFSLARCQMAFWSFLSITAYVFIWVTLGDLNTLTDSVLILIGIGSGTALGAKLIDSSKMDQAAPTSQETTKAAPSQKQPLTSVKGRASGRLLVDLVTGEDGVSLHRLQMVIWTLVLGMIFCVSVYRTLTMPEFSSTLLGLMGISSGTYLGFKYPEKPKSRESDDASSQA